MTPEGETRAGMTDVFMQMQIGANVTKANGYNAGIADY